MTKCETCTCIICKLSLVWYKRIYQRCMFLPWKRVAVWKQIAIKVFFLYMGSHNVLQFDCSQKASNFKTPPLFYLNASTHSDALKKKLKKHPMHFAGKRFNNSVETPIDSWPAGGAKSLNPCHCFREMESAIPLLSEMICTAVILKLWHNYYWTMALKRLIKHSSLAVLEFKMWTNAMWS